MADANTPKITQALEELVRLSRDLVGEVDIAHVKFLRNDLTLNLEHWNLVSGIVGQVVDKRDEIRTLLAEAQKDADIKEIVDLIDGKQP